MYNIPMHKASTQKQAQPPFGVFLAATIVVFFLVLSSAESVGFVPSYIDGSSEPVALSNLPELGEESSAVNSSEVAEVDAVLPARISIGAIDLDLSVQNPDTKDIATLDALLTSGPARYVSSAKLGETGTMIIFAHSSHLPIVHNKMYQAFNNIPELQSGDTITLTGENGVQYLYRVKSVEKADAEDTTIDMSPSLGTRLVLVTCDTLTSKSSRFVLEAAFIGTVGN